MQRLTRLIEPPFNCLGGDRQQRGDLVDTGFFEIVHQHDLALFGGQSLDGTPQCFQMF